MPPDNQPSPASIAAGSDMILQHIDLDPSRRGDKPTRAFTRALGRVRGYDRPALSCP